MALSGALYPICTLVIAPNAPVDPSTLDAGETRFCGVIVRLSFQMPSNLQAITAR